MTKTVCDVCGKDISPVIKAFSNAYEFRLVPKVAVRGGISNNITNDYTIICTDVCENCANSIYHYIKGLQKEDNK